MSSHEVFEVAQKEHRRKTKRPLSRETLLESTWIVPGMSRFSAVTLPMPNKRGSPSRKFLARVMVTAIFYWACSIAWLLQPATVSEPITSDFGHILEAKRADALRWAFLKSNHDFLECYRKQCRGFQHEGATYDNHQVSHRKNGPNSWNGMSYEAPCDVGCRDCLH